MAGGGTPIGTFGIMPWPIAMPIGAKRPEEKKQYHYQQVSSSQQMLRNCHEQKI
jgi:hypothetical protein